MRGLQQFFAWCEDRGLTLATIRPFDVAAWVEQLQENHGAPGVKQQLAAVRMMFDWLITGQVVPMNPAAAVRGPKHVVKTGKTPVLDGDEWRKLIDSIPTETVRDLRDRALIATLTYSFARITAALQMKVEDLRPQGAGWRIQLHEKGGKEHAMPCHHALAEALRAYIDAAGIAEDRKGWLFRTSPRHNATVLTEQPMAQADAWRMIRRRAVAAGITRRSAITRFGRPASPLISAMAARSSTHSPWQRMKARAQLSSTTGRKSGLPRTRSRGSGYEAGYYGLSHAHFDQKSRPNLPKRLSRPRRKRPRRRRARGRLSEAAHDSGARCGTRIYQVARREFA